MGNGRRSVRLKHPLLAGLLIVLPAFAPVQHCQNRFLLWISMAFEGVNLGSFTSAAPTHSLKGQGFIPPLLPEPGTLLLLIVGCVAFLATSRPNVRSCARVGNALVLVHQWRRHHHT